MRYLGRRLPVCCGLPFLMLLSACDGAKPECDSPETRSAVLKVISSDHANRLGTYAASHPPANSDAAGQAASKSEKPLYVLGEKIVTTSTSADKKTLQCSGAISATVNGTKASKEVNFTVQQETDGKISVSVEPFQF